MAQFTQRTYNSGQQHYLWFCQHTSLQPIPASEHQLVLFATFLALKGLKWQTIKTYLSAVCHHLLKGPQESFSDSARLRLQLMLRSIKKATSTWPAKAQVPITPNILRQVWQAMHQSPVSEDCVMLWAAMTTCFLGSYEQSRYAALPPPLMIHRGICATQM